MEMKSGKYRYILRFCMQPGFDEEEKTQRLLDFCRKAAMDEVMFFIMPEELNSGHPTPQEVQPWLDVIRRTKERLSAYGIATSINPWTTTLHCDRGRTLKPGQDFELMVDSLGQQTTAVACPMGQNFREYITGIYRSYAALEPDTVWVEDDFRLHNHEPLEWGGCFCESHMAEYSRRIGHPVTREEFVKGVLQPGQPHPYRKVWLDTARDVMVDLAQLIGKAVREVSPHTKVGLMSSAPFVHCAEGRDWSGILYGLSAGQTPVTRCHLPAYGETTPQQYLNGFHRITRYCRVLKPQETLEYSELESCTFTQFNKSHKFTRFQLETSLIADATGITLDIFDFMGNGVYDEDGTSDMYREARPFLDALTGLGLKSADQRGVLVPVSPLSSRTLHTAEGKSMHELYPAEDVWGATLSAYGIPCAYTIRSDVKGQVVALAGQYLRNLAPDQIESLFTDNFILLDGAACRTLFEMGLGRLAGIRSIHRENAANGRASYEQVAGEEVYAGFRHARLTAQMGMGDWFQIEYEGKNESVTQVFDRVGTLSGPGMTLLPGRVLIFPYDLANANTKSPVRRDILQGILLREKRFTGVIVEGGAMLEPFLYPRALLLVNGLNDPQMVKLRFAGEQPVKVRVLRRGMNTPQKCVYTLKDGLMVLDEPMEPLEVMALVW